MTGDTRDIFFQGVQRAQEESLDARREQSRLNLEETVVKQIFKLVGMALPLKQLTAEFEQDTGHTQPTFEWFERRYPAFPLKLGAARIAWAHEVDLWMALEKFGKTKIFGAYQEFMDSRDWDPRAMSVAFSFRWNNRLMVLHNMPHMSDQTLASHDEETGSALLFRHKDVIYYVEKWPQLMHVVGTSWTGNG